MIVSIVKCVLLRLPLLILIPAFPAAGQDVSYQLRLIGHIQIVRAGDRFGLAAWSVLPDVMNQTSLRALLFGGGVYKRETGWIDFMGGALLSRTEKTTYEIDVRYSGRLSRISVFAEGEYNRGRANGSSCRARRCPRESHTCGSAWARRAISCSAREAN